MTESRWRSPGGPAWLTSPRANSNDAAGQTTAHRGPVGPHAGTPCSSPLPGLPPVRTGQEAQEDVLGLPSLHYRRPCCVCGRRPCTAGLVADSGKNDHTPAHTRARANTHTRTHTHKRAHTCTHPGAAVKSPPPNYPPREGKKGQQHARQETHSSTSFLTTVRWDFIHFTELCRSHPTPEKHKAADTHSLKYNGARYREDAEDFTIWSKHPQGPSLGCGLH